MTKIPKNLATVASFCCADNEARKLKEVNLATHMMIFSTKVACVEKQMFGVCKQNKAVNPNESDENLVSPFFCVKYTKSKIHQLFSFHILAPDALQHFIGQATGISKSSSGCFRK